MDISDGLNIVFTGKHDSTELVFTIPTLKDLVNVQDKQTVPYKIEALFTDYTQIIMESEMELLNPPSVNIEKLTHVKKEPVKEEIEPIKIEEKIEFKKSKFSKAFEVFIKQGEVK